VRLASFLVITALLPAAWWFWLVRRCAESGPGALSFAGLLAGSQLVLTGMILGAAGVLRLPLMLASLGVVTALVLLAGVRRRATRLPVPDRPRDAPGLDAGNVALGLLALAAVAWILTATWLLPPRGADDLSYHLPPVFQAVQTGSLALLPLELRGQFAMPLGAELLYLWPAIFFHADTWVDGAQLAVAIYGAVVLYALTRELGATARHAWFAALLFFLTPVVLAQSGSNYNDLTLAVCHLALLFAVVRFWRSGLVRHLLLAGLAGGFALGVKYNALIPVLLLQPLILLRLARDGGLQVAVRRYALFGLIVLLVPAYWLSRNWLVTGLPFFPYELGIGGLKSSFEQTATFASGLPLPGGRALKELFSSPMRLLLFLFRDPGLGSLNGGFGLAFWGPALPALAWCGRQAWRSARARDWFPLLFWSQVPLVLLLYLAQTDVTRIAFTMRLALVLVPLGLLALALALDHLGREWPAGAIAVRATCVAGAALSVMQLDATRLPGFAVTAAVEDRRAGTTTTPQRYYAASAGDLPSLATVFEPLDYISPDGPGWTVYMAADWTTFVTAPLFGSRLQNVVWNFLDEPAADPDAAVFHPGFSGQAWRMFYVGRRITPAAMAGDDRYLLLTRSGPTELWVRAERLADPAVRARLMAYYERRYGADIAALRPLVRGLPAADAVIVSSDAAHALRYFQLRGDLAIPMRHVRPGAEAEEAGRFGAVALITVPAPLPGAVHRPIAEASLASGRVTFHLNEVPREPG
jgi:hypothetical protein